MISFMLATNWSWIEFKKHYIKFYNVNTFNQIFQKPFQKINQPYTPQKFIRIQPFLPTTKFKIIHNFLKHYDDGKFDPPKQKPTDTWQRGSKTNVWNFSSKS